MRITVGLVLFAALASGCKKKDNANPGAGSANPSGTGVTGSNTGSAGVTATADGGTGSGSAGGSAADVVTAKKLPIPPNATRIDADFKTPESVLYDRANDVYYVSNINGDPAALDDNGFISKIKPDGTVEALKWIDGAAEDVRLDAPKGMAIANGSLYVADVNAVRTFDLKMGKGGVEIPLQGAMFVNDLVASPDGKVVYASDTGVDKTFSPSGTDAIWRIEGDKAITLVKDKALGNPNGLVTSADGASLWTVTFGSGELREVTRKGALKTPQKLPKGKLDGVVWHGDTLLVSSWEAQAIYQGKPGGEWKELVSGVEAPADIGYDDKRKAVLVPRFNGNDVLIIPVP